MLARKCCRGVAAVAQWSYLSKIYDGGPEQKSLDQPLTSFQWIYHPDWSGLKQARADPNRVKMLHTNKHIKKPFFV